MMVDEEIGQRVFEQVVDMWINPEIERRKESGRFPEDFALKGVQILMSLEGSPVEIRFNKEVKAILEAKINRGVAKGEAICYRDIDSIENIKLTDEDPNSAHITLLLMPGNQWKVSFDFRYNRKLVKDHIERAKEFYGSCEDNFEKKRWGPFYDNGFSCAELLAKSILLQIPDKDVLNGKGAQAHGERKKKFKGWAELGNVKMEFSSILSKLGSLRGSARYLDSDEFKLEDPQKILDVLGEMIEFAEKSID